MSTRLEMLQVARLAPTVLGESSSAKIRAFVEGCFRDDGAAGDRAGDADLYYTVFAIECLVALQAEPSPCIDTTRAWLAGFGSSDELDLVHRTCLIRCSTALDAPIDRALQGRALEAFRDETGGYTGEGDRAHTNVYHSFLAVAARQDLGLGLLDTDRLADAILAMRARDGAWANHPDLPVGSTTVTAAAVTLLRQLGRRPPPETADWLFARLHDRGGFLAAPAAPMPDLLSTATALHALSGLGAPIDRVREPCLDYLDTLWTGTSFCGHWADDALDCEYTFYALLALGHLSV